MSLSQAFSAGSNFVILLVLGRMAGASQVGEYALAFVAYVAALGLQRAGVTDVMLARAPGSTAPVHDEGRFTITMSLMLSSAAALIALIIGLVTPYHQLALLAPFLIGLLLQDACRYLSFRRSEEHRAVVLDGIWLAGSCASFFVLHRWPTHSAAIIVWGSAGAIAGLVGLFMMRIRPASPALAVSWWRVHVWPSCRWLTTEALFYHTDQEVVAFGFTALAGARLFGEYQIALSFVGASVFLTSAIGILATRHMTRSAGTESGPAVWTAFVSFACVVAWTLFIVLISGLLVRVLYRGRVDIPAGMLVAAGAITALAAAATGPQALLLARRTERVIAAARGTCLLLFAPLAVVVSSWNFTAALWVLVLDAALYLAILSWAASRPAASHHFAAPAMSSSNLDWNRSSV
jgi:hypothetical protein